MKKRILQVVRGILLVLLLAIAGISLAGLAVLVHKSARRKDIAPRDDDDEDTED